MKKYKPSELSKTPSAPATWIVDKLLRTNRKRVSLLCGTPHAGKSTLARQLALAVAHGEPFLGRQTLQCKVAYWQTEETPEDAAQDFIQSVFTVSHKDLFQNQPCGFQTAPLPDARDR